MATCAACPGPASIRCTACRREFCAAHAWPTDFGARCGPCERRTRRTLTCAAYAAVALVALVALVLLGLVVRNVRAW